MDAEGREDLLPPTTWSRGKLPAARRWDDPRSGGQWQPRTTTVSWRSAQSERLPCSRRGPAARTGSWSARSCGQAGNTHHQPSTMEFNPDAGSGCRPGYFDSGAVRPDSFAWRGFAPSTTRSELDETIKGRNAISDFLRALCLHSSDHFAWAKEIWDIPRSPTCWMRAMMLTEIPMKPSNT